MSNPFDEKERHLSASKKYNSRTVYPSKLIESVTNDNTAESTLDKVKSSCVGSSNNCQLRVQLPIDLCP